uniref:Aos n=1 Tax=Arundo donax TaxID=35708 RepID=A0A0A9IFC9_ARUDO
MGKLLASRTATTRGSRAMKGPGGTLMRTTVEP